MSDDSSSSKTEQPTPKKLKDARKKGQVATSKEVTASAVILAAVLYFIFFFDDISASIIHLMILPGEYMDTPFSHALPELSWIMFKELLVITFQFIAVILLAVLASVFIQIGWLWAPEKLKLNIQSLNPINGAKNIISKKNLFETFKSIMKILIYVSVAIWVIYINIDSIVYLFGCDAQCQMDALGAILLQMFAVIAIILLLLSILDYSMQHHIHIKELMMTKDEVQREYKDVEGNQDVKHKRKEIHKEILEGSADRVGVSSAIVTNPTHIAIGIFYDKERTPLPIVTLIETDEKAEAIKMAAERMNKPIIEDIPLARGLYEEAKIDNYVPDQFLDSVARVLRWAKQLSGLD